MSAECRGFVGEFRIEVLASKGHAWLRQGRFQRPEIPDAQRSTCRLHQALMELQDLAEREIAHSGEAAVQLSVLVEDTPGDGVKVLRWLRQEVAHGSGSQLIRRHFQPLGNLGKAALSVAGEL